jgi:hypothetical protein
MGSSRLKLYAPFLALLLVQAMFIALAPSRGTGDVAFGEAGAGEDGFEGEGFDDADFNGEDFDGENVDGGEDGDLQGEDIAFEDGEDPDAADAGDGGDGGDAPGAGASSGGGGGGGGASGGSGGGSGGGGDTSHCKNGKQHDVVYHAPPCKPKFSGDNGGATYQGVTADEVRIVFFRERKNPHVAALLNQEGLARTDAEEEAYLKAAEEFVNKRYEFYGRKVRFILHHAQECPETPPDVPACRREARRIVDQHKPFMVLWPVPLYPDVFDEFAKRQVIAVGGWHFDKRYFADRRPFRYDIFMDGTSTVEMLGEFYCKKMARKNASHSGRVIHPTIGARDEVPRRLGIISPEGDAFNGPVQRLSQIVAGCDRQAPVVARYQSDIERAQSQSASNIQQMINGNVTTVVCICDPIAPIFRASAMTQQNYYPENLLAGSGLLDYDKLGRLYDPAQWAHAFGPGHIQVYPRFADSDAVKVWRDVGRSGEPCQGCNLPWVYYSFAASAVQNAGPNLTPQTVERGMLSAPPSGGWQQTGGRDDIVLFRFGRGDYTGVSDAREVYWDSSATSRLDGRPGAYVALNKGRRYTKGQFDGSFGFPVSPR